MLHGSGRKSSWKAIRMPGRRANALGAALALALLALPGNRGPADGLVRIPIADTSSTATATVSRTCSRRPRSSPRHRLRRVCSTTRWPSLQGATPRGASAVPGQRLCPGRLRRTDPQGGSTISAPANGWRANWTAEHFRGFLYTTTANGRLQIFDGSPENDVASPGRPRAPRYAYSVAFNPDGSVATVHAAIEDRARDVRLRGQTPPRGPASSCRG